MTDASTRLFNSPLEAGLRALFVLTATGRRALDIEQLVGFEYALLFSSELGGPPSLHPRAPAQGQQLLVRRALIQEGLELMASRDLVAQKFRASGIGYAATKAGQHVAEQFDSEYAADLRARALWVVKKLGGYTRPQLEALLSPHARRLIDEVVFVEHPGQVTLNFDE